MASSRRSRILPSGVIAVVSIGSGRVAAFAPNRHARLVPLRGGVLASPPVRHPCPTGPSPHGTRFNASASLRGMAGRRPCDAARSASMPHLVKCAEAATGSFKARISPTHVMPAVDGEVRAGDPGGFLAGEEGDGVGDFLRL